MGTKLIDSMKPLIFKQSQYNILDIDRILNSIDTILIDLYETQLEEFFEILHPDQKFLPEYPALVKEYVRIHLSNDPKLHGDWIYFPWNKNMVHMIDQSSYLKLKSNRNKYLINDQENNIIENFKIAVLGLSIGGNIATTLAYSNISHSIKLADFDVLSTTNLNRIHAQIYDINKPKIDIISQQIYGINPYSTIYRYPKGVNNDNISEFLNDGFKPNLIIEEIDDFEMKIRIRIEAKKNKIPVLMLTNLGDCLLIDIERYDIDKDLQIFNGLLDTLPEEILKNPISEQTKVKYAIQIVGKEHLSTKLLQSLYEINKTISGRPQLNSTVTIGSGYASTIARKIALNENIKSGRIFIDFNKQFGSTINKDESQKR